MIGLPLSQAGQILGVGLDSDESFEGITTDSRKIRPGMLFAALPGERVDGHNFVAQAQQSGAAGLLVQRPVHADIPQLRVGSVLTALGTLAAAWREKHNVKVVGITGSNGKTTTKEMVANVLRRSGSVLATSGNFNNELGLPLTLFGLNSRHDFAVLEMGAGKAGDIRYLAGLAKPDVGVITNVGPAHLKGMGSVKGIARTKGELYAALPKEGFAIFNKDESWLDLWQSLASDCHAVTFGLDSEAMVWAEFTTTGPRIHTPKGNFDLQLQLPGRHNVLNALAATSITLALDIGLEDIAAGLADSRPVPGRLNLLEASGGWRVIDDTYNANPASLYAAMQVLTGEPGEAWLALGDMRELGPDSDRIHAEMGRAAADLGVRRVYATGRHSMSTAEAFGEGARHFGNREALIDALRDDLHPGVTCLVKGSRSMGMEQVVEAIRNGERNGDLNEKGAG